MTWGSARRTETLDQPASPDTRGKINLETGYSRPARRTQRLTIAVQKASVREVTVRWKTKLTVACLWEKKQRQCMRYANGERLFDRRVFELLGRGIINASLYSPSCVAGWSHWYSPPGPWVETQAHKRTRGIIIFLHPPSTKHPLSLSLSPLTFALTLAKPSSHALAHQSATRTLSANSCDSAFSHRVDCTHW